MPDLPPLPASWNKANRVIGKFGVEEEEEGNECKDDEQAEGRDSNEQGKEANLHNIALAQCIIHDASVQKSLPQQMQKGLFWVAMMMMMRAK